MSTVTAYKGGSPLPEEVADHIKGLLFEIKGLDDDTRNEALMVAFSMLMILYSNTFFRSEGAAQKHFTKTFDRLCEKYVSELADVAVMEEADKLVAEILPVAVKRTIDEGWGEHTLGTVVEDCVRKHVGKFIMDNYECSSEINITLERKEADSGP